MRGIYEFRIDKYVYVGQAESIERRQREHLKTLRAGRHDNSWVQRAYDKYGLNQEGWFRVLELVPDREALTPREQFWIDCRVEELGRERVMNISLAANNPMSDPAVRERHLAAVRSPETRAKMSAKVISPEARSRMATAKVAAAYARETPFVFYDPQGRRTEVYNLSAFCRENSLDKGEMSKVLSGKARQHKGWTKGDNN